MLVKALLVAFWAGLCSLDDGGMQLQIRKPLLAGTITGLILGDLTQGLIIGGTLELMWLGVNSVGAYTPPDITGGAIIGVTVGITSGGGVAAGVAFAVPAATLILQLIVLLQTYLSVHIHRAEAAAVAGDFDKANRWHLYSGILLFFARAIPCFIAVYIGNTVLSDFIAWLPKFIITGLNVASGIIPAVGISMLLTMMLKKICGCTLWEDLFLQHISACLFLAYLSSESFLPVFMITTMYKERSWKQAIRWN